MKGHRKALDPGGRDAKLSRRIGLQRCDGDPVASSSCFAEHSDEACPDTQEAITGNPDSFTQSRIVGICDLNP